MHPAGRGLNHDGRFVVEGLGNGMQLAGVGVECRGPAAPSVVAGTDLDPRFEVAERSVFAVTEVPLRARGARRIEVSADAAQNRF